MAVLFCVILIDLIGFGIVIPILPFLSPQLGADKMDIALVIVTYATCAGLSGPQWGKLSDRIGRKPVIIICLAGAVLAYLMLAFASALWMVFAARGFAGLMAGNFGVASAMIADITTTENRARGMGLIGAAFGAGIVLGPVMGGLLTVDGTGFTLPCLVAGVMSLLAIVAAAFFLLLSLPADKRAAIESRRMTSQSLSLLQLLRHTKNRLFVFQFVLHQAAVSTIVYMFPLWMGEELGFSAREVGIVFGIQGVIMVIFQGGLLGILARVLGEWRLLHIAVTLLLLGLLSASMADTMITMVGSIFVAMTGATLCVPMLNTIISYTTALEYRGRMMGITNAASSWGRVMGPLVAGTSLSLLGFSSAWLVSALLVSVYLILTVFFSLKRPVEHPQANVQ